MSDQNELLELVETLVHEQKGEYLSDLQRIILAASLDDSGKRKTYEAIANETGYSPKYIKQGIAPTLWQLLSELFGEKVSKSNIFAVLSQYQKQHPPQPKTTQQATSQPAETSKVSLLTPTAAIPTSNAKAVILLVDDQPQNLALLTDMLESEGYDVRQAINGRLALNVVKIQPPDLILLDVNMPEMNGYEVCRQLKADPSTASIPVIFISALNESWDKVQAFSVGAADYITKPPKVVEVIARITNQLNLSKAYQQFRRLSAHLQYSQRLLRDAGLVDAHMGLMTRDYFEQRLTEKWPGAIAAQQSMALVLVKFSYLSVGVHTDFPAEWQTLITHLLSLVDLEQVEVAHFAPFTVAILMPGVSANHLTEVQQAIAQQLEPYKLPLSMDFQIFSHNAQPSETLTSQQFLAAGKALLP
ncbi:response regulator receiver protein [[Leptolyngbya] sp. PCC 7376]|uniref:response regulator n=1 Tax=[Leptolyngbya] sp. PCC 7376 TaxID=111781 RepID=UPI00029EFAAD|nr:response regulator [[Leptolyngbya] sp. PCC 7376]AFY39846.1 response regulator receiver protein [[Leptolyngbya] sp. PCC 7376]